MRPDAAGELLGTPLVVSGFMAGRQQANPVDVQTWARELAHLLVRIHAIRPTARQRRSLYAGNEHGLYFLSGEWPRKLAGHPLSEQIYGTIRQLRPALAHTDPVFLHSDYWPGNVGSGGAVGSSAGANAAFSLMNQSYVTIILDPAPAERAIDREFPCTAY